jgi:hypothetical protein
MSGVSIVVVDKSGTLKSVKMKIPEEIAIETPEFTDAVAKKCGFKTVADFEEACIWEFDDVDIHMYGKLSGRANFENKYDFPPPIDELLFFGSCGIVATDKMMNPIDLSVKQWHNIYEELFGGFEDLGSETSSEDELENIPDEMKTDDGYLKDDFVVENDVIEYDDSKNDSSSESAMDADEGNSVSSSLHEEDFFYTDDEM